MIYYQPTISDPFFIEVFIITYRQFVSALTFFNILSAQYTQTVAASPTKGWYLSLNQCARARGIEGRRKRRAEYRSNIYTYCPLLTNTKIYDDVNEYQHHRRAKAIYRRLEIMDRKIFSTRFSSERCKGTPAVRFVVPVHVPS